MLWKTAIIPFALLNRHSSSGKKNLKTLILGRDHAENVASVLWVVPALSCVEEARFSAKLCIFSAHLWSGDTQANSPFVCSKFAPVTVSNGFFWGLLCVQTQSGTCNIKAPGWGLLLLVCSQSLRFLHQTCCTYISATPSFQRDCTAHLKPRNRYV